MRFGRRELLLLPLFVLAVVVVAVPTIAFGDHDNDNVFRAQLAGIHEVPSINTVATGTVRLELFADHINFTVSWSNLSSNPLVSHIHIGQARTNGAPSAFFCGGGGQPACPAATSATISGTITAANVVGPAAQGIAPGNLAGLERMIRLGATYSNVHTANFGNGEIRGQNRSSDSDKD